MLLSSALAVRAMACANHSLQTCFSQKELFIEYGIFNLFNPFAPGDFAEKRVLKLVEWFSGHCRAIKS